jgi:predicted glycogen debranching enzyme
MHDLLFGRDVCGRDAEASRLEWLVTNGLGSYAMGTVSGALTRRYHGLLIAALQPPVRRTRLLSKLAERVRVHGGAWVELDTQHRAGGAANPAGHVHLESFAFEGTTPVWRWALGETRLEKRVWMEPGEQTTRVEYRLVSGATVTLELRVLADARDHHETTAAADDGHASALADGLAIRMREDAPTVYVRGAGARSAVAGEWLRGLTLAVETERGLDHVTDVWWAGTLERELASGDAWPVSVSIEAGAGSPRRASRALARRERHERALLAAFDRAHGRLAKRAPAWIRRLVLAADQFVVARAHPDDPAGRTVVAGYPWFTDWGRDTMIALPGLALATGRPGIARAILLQFSRHVSEGMLPNYWPDEGAPAEYNTVDAALWFFQAVRATVEPGGDDALLAELWPALESIALAYERGTRFGIRVDPADGLVTQGADGVALTWMDARVGDWVVTPRRGKPVEINALWHAALLALAELAPRVGRDAAPWRERASRVRASFARFWNEPAGALFDVLDGPAGDDAAIRPNQVFAVSLGGGLLPNDRARRVVEAVGRHLVTSHGLRSLAPEHPDYRGVFTGGRRERDGAYHQGTVWTWLLPAHALAYWRATGDLTGARAALAGLEGLQRGFGLGTLPEVADGDPPHRAAGCMAQAWSVAETLRVWLVLERAGS